MKIMAKPSGILCRLNRHSQMLKRLDRMCQESLPSPLNQHCHVANLREKTLVIHADSSLWATRLRLILPSLKLKWQENQLMPTISQVDVRVRPLEIVKHR